MNNYVIFADSACDIAPEILAKWGVRYESLTFTFEGESRQYSNSDMPAKEFYAKMRSGAIARTAAANVDDFKGAFEKELKRGNDILYLGFSTGLSATYNSGRIAAEELAKLYPERKLLTVDTLCASAGFGLLLYLTIQKKNNGASIEEAAKFALETRPHLCHWFTVDDLVYLKRGGRVSPTLAFVGGLLGIKPVMHMDDEGKLINVTKVRGRNAALKALADKYGELAVNPGSDTVYISHGDCMEDVEKLSELLKKGYGVKVELVADVGPVIGAHSGPGTMALFFIGKER